MKVEQKVKAMSEFFAAFNAYAMTHPKILTAILSLEICLTGLI